MRLSWVGRMVPDDSCVDRVPRMGALATVNVEFLSVVATVEAKYGPTTALFDLKFLCDALAIEWGEFCIRYSIAIKLICKNVLSMYYSPGNISWMLGRETSVEGDTGVWERGEVIVGKF